MGIEYYVYISNIYGYYYNRITYISILRDYYLLTFQQSPTPNYHEDKNYIKLKQFIIKLDNKRRRK